jgi:hypothetical protein
VYCSFFVNICSLSGSGDVAAQQEIKKRLKALESKCTTSAKKLDTLNTTINTNNTLDKKALHLLEDIKTGLQDLSHRMDTLEHMQDHTHSPPAHATHHHTPPLHHTHTSQHHSPSPIKSDSCSEQSSSDTSSSSHSSSAKSHSVHSVPHHKSNHHPRHRSKKSKK